MNLLEDPKSIICPQCNRKITNYQSKFCRRKLLSSHSLQQQQQQQQRQQNNQNETRDRSIQIINIINIDPKLNEFIKETQDNSVCCDDFVEWIPRKSLDDVKYLTRGGNSKIFRGSWDGFTIPLALKAIKDSDNINDVLNEFKMHHKCRSQNVIPFYGITKLPEENEYAMVIKRAKYGDLRKYINQFFTKLTWSDKVEILIKLSKALNSLHQMNLVHRDFHCKNILVDEDKRILISDFGLCKPIDSKLAQNSSIQGVLPYIAPEVLKNKPYTKQSEVYSMSMIMWELTSNEPPFSNKCHDKMLALAILNGLRPTIIEGTPDFYANIMKQCWNSDPSQRPNSSLLPKLFEEMRGLCKFIDNNPTRSYLVIPSLNRNIPASEFTISTPPIDFTTESKEKVSVKNDDNSVDAESLLPQPNSATTDSKEISIESEYETKTETSEYTISTPPIDFSKIKGDSSFIADFPVQLGSDEKVSELLKTTDQVVVEYATKKVVKKKADQTVVEKVQKSVTEEECVKVIKTQNNDGPFELSKHKTENIGTSTTENLSEAASSVESAPALITLQKSDGSITLNETVSEQIDISSENLQSSVNTYGVSDKLKNISKSVWETALTLPYLTITSQSKDRVDQHKEQSKKAKTYLIQELKDEKLVEELLTTSDKIIVEHSVQKEKKEAVATIQTSTTTEKANEIVSCQNDDGSLQLNDTVSKELDVGSSDSLISSIKSYFDTNGVKLPESKSLLDTTVALSKTSSFKEKYESAKKYLKIQLGSEEKDEELLKTPVEVVVEHVTKKVVKEKAGQTVVEKVQESKIEECNKELGWVGRVGDTVKHTIEDATSAVSYARKSPDIVEDWDNNYFDQEDARYITQTYDFSLDDLNQSYNDNENVV